MEMKKYEILEQKMCKELETLEEKFRGGAEMSMQDLEKIDKLYHALKSKATYDAMKEAEEGYGENGFSGYSGMRGRNAYTGRYMSRDSGNSYADGYSQGYSEAMSQMSNAANNGNSGHYPMIPPQYNRW